MDINNIIDFIFRNGYNLSYSGDKSAFMITDNNGKLFCGGCNDGSHYTIIRKQDTWLLSKCLDGCGKCKACTDGIWVEETSGFIQYENGQ